jgi:hypothetical protein
VQLRHSAHVRFEVHFGDHAEDCAKQPAQIAEIGLDDLIDGRILDLHRHAPTVLEPCQVDLSDRSRRERLFIEALEELADLAPQRSLDFEAHHLRGNPRCFAL